MAIVPTPFRAQQNLARLNVAAVGLSLAAATAAVMHGVGNAPLAIFFPTAIIGALWAWILRTQATLTVFGKKRNVGWLVSPALAAMNSAAIGALLLFEPRQVFGSMAAGALVGATVGAIFWIPALLLTLLFFGLPIARARRLAERGLAGEERGEITVGLVCFAISAFALVRAPQIPAVAIGGALGAIAGGLASASALARARRRRAFVEAAEAGSLPGYRVEETREGKVLLRVAEKKSYRVADFEEELFDLDAEGEAIRPATRRLDE